MRKISTIISRSDVKKVREELEIWIKNTTDPKLMETTSGILKKIKRDAKLSEDELNLLGTYLNSLPE